MSQFIMLERLSLLENPKLFVYILTALVVGLILSVTSYFLLFLRPPERFFAYNPNSVQYQEIKALSQPNASSREIINWASVAATAAYTLDFLHAEKTLEKIRQYFTKDGYDAFRAALSESGRVEDIIGQKLAVSSVLSGPAMIVREGVFHGIYSWEVQMPMILTYQGASLESTPKKILLKLLITRVPTQEAPKGIGIAQLLERSGN